MILASNEENNNTWEWISASIQPTSIGDRNEKESVMVLINDADSNLNGNIIHIPSHQINDDNILMANTWSSDEMLSFESKLGTCFDKFGDVTTQVAAKIKEKKWRKNQNSSRNNKHHQNSKNSTHIDLNETSTAFLPPNDLIHLTHLHEAAVVYCLKERYKLDEIYTSTGPILIALNPFKECPILYSPKVMQTYLENGEEMSGFYNRKKSKQSNLNKKLPPHVYAVADDAYRNMIRTLNDKREMQSNSNLNSSIETSNHSILVSGESGAGKTVTTKIIMKYLATLSKFSIQSSGRHSIDKIIVSKKNNAATDRTIEHQILQSNPILESFGNARTIRNDNSSRFGKYIEIQFSEHGLLTGASIDTYLLEKVRLVSQAPGERNYHIFYEILAGASRGERGDFHLDGCDATDFYMISTTGVFDRRDGVEDEKMYYELKRAMQIIGFSSEEQYDVLSVASAILHLSNVSFVEIGDAESELDFENPFLPAALSLLQVPAEALNEALCLCSIEAGGETMYKMLTMKQSRKALEAIIKAMYGALFSYIVDMVNEFITIHDNTNKAAFIGVLDIFGFESFGTNSFEQLCINYCNEALQQQFNRFIFKTEQEEYNNEGISWSFISFPDNQDVIDLIEKKHSGILSILDEQCLLGSCTDRSFALAMYDKCVSHKRFSSDRKQQASGFFSIMHYAGPVEYDTNFFLEKNKDELPKEATELLQCSSSPFLQYLGNVLETSSISSKNTERSPSNIRSYGRKNSSLVRISLGGQFRLQLGKLRDRINDTLPHYIRCLKPNDLLMPNRFDPAVIADQLRCGGILEAIRVSRVGFPQRYLHDRFVHRYSILAGNELRFYKGNSATSRKNACRVLFESIAQQILEIKHTNSDDKQHATGKQHRNFESKRINFDSPKNSKYYNKKFESNGSNFVQNGRTNYLDAGMQLGKTKVFIRRWAFDIIEQLLGKKKSNAATLINSVVRMFLGRCRFLYLVEEYYNANWAKFSEEEQYEIAAQRGYFDDDPGYEIPEREHTYGLIEKFENLRKPQQWKSASHFKWRMVDGRWMKH